MKAGYSAKLDIQKTARLKVLLGKCKLNIGTSMVVASLLDRLGEATRTAEVCPNFRLQLGGGSRQVLTRLNCHLHLSVDGLPIWASKHSTGAEKGQRIVIRAGIVNCDVPQHVLRDLLRKIDVDAKEVGISLGGLDFLKETLEPSKRWCVTANPEELDTAERTKLPFPLSVPNVLEDRREWSNTDTSANEYSNFRVENILCGGSIWTINPDFGKSDSRDGRIKLNEVAARHACLAVLLGTLHGSGSHGSYGGRADSEALAEGTSEITHLTDMNGYVWVFRRRRDGERMPLEARDLWNLNKEPLASGILETRLDNTELHSATWVDKDFG